MQQADFNIFMKALSILKQKKLAFIFPSKILSAIFFYLSYLFSKIETESAS